MGIAELLGHPYVVLLIRWTLGGVLAVAGIAKLCDRAMFVRAVHSFRILPPRLSQQLGLVIPYVEVGTGLLLLIGLESRLAAVLAIVLFTGFAVAIGVNVLRGVDLDCHCFGTLHREKIGLLGIVRSVTFAVGAADVALFPGHYLAADGWLLGANLVQAGDPPISGLIPLVLVVAAASVAYVVIRQIWTLI